MQDIHRDGDVVRAIFTPQKCHQGFPGILHGGIVSAALDEAMSYACVLIGGHWSATLKTELRFRRPAPAVGHLSLTAGIDRQSAGSRFRTWAQLTLTDGEICADATALFIASPALLGELVPPFATSSGNTAETHHLQC